MKRLRLFLSLCATAVFPAALVCFAASGDAYIHAQRAYEKLTQRDYHGALESANAAIALDPREYSAHGHRATSLVLLGEYPEAEKAAQESIRLRPDNAYAYRALVQAQLRLGRYRDAQESVYKGLAYKGDDARLLKLKADIEFALRGEGGGIDYEAFIAGAVLLLLLGGGGLWMWKESSVSADKPEPDPVHVRPGASASVEVGHILGGKYKLTHVIGRGGMGRVWEGVDIDLDRPVAVKELSVYVEGVDVRGYFIKEAKTVAAVHHRNIADIYDILDLPEGLYMVLEMIRGKTIEHLLVERKKFLLEHAKAILRPVCSALEYAHSRGVIHRDIKPANIMMTDQGFVKLLDFGIARKIEDGGFAVSAGVPEADAQEEQKILLARTRTIVGTPGYMPPEAQQGIVSPASDVYSLGVTFYEMIAGGRPPIPFPGGVSAGVDAFMRDVTASDYRARISSMKDFNARLQAL